MKFWGFMWAAYKESIARRLFKVILLVSEAAGLAALGGITVVLFKVVDLPTVTPSIAKTGTAPTISTSRVSRASSPRATGACAGPTARASHDRLSRQQRPWLSLWRYRP